MTYRRTPTPTLDGLSSSAVIRLMFYKYDIEARNDIAARTKLLSKHPELFDREILLEIFSLHMQLKSQAMMKKRAG